ncbi:tripartite tricarboxylate transporter substrate-binding protein [Ramlibacter tataouinensis]|uniref:Bug family tripartite tricarboxylate transporter substrate binding protein n=1 Tax=Ramlibacter tataouinensis TaxID=94132 RepID=UPI0022F3F58E|nr:tripartite tricarboxylate transporter substrate-binding protein [Ramlibacter tataouinensis]WBY03391.1 tripartite tricarboxylate transporter substrate-binding protein [Ramlibacter tataouinensis]
MRHPLPSRLSAALAAAAAVATLAAPALAQTAAWPTKPVKVLVGSPPGGPSDLTARSFAEQLGKRTSQPVVVENRPGAGNNLAAGLAAKAEPDGHTLVLSPDTVLTVNPLVYRNTGFDARTDLTSVSVLASFTQMLVCNPATGVGTVAELAGKAKAGPLTYASGGPGVPGHLAAEMFVQAAGIRMQHVPYRGPAPATLGVLAGEVNCGFLATPTVIQHVKADKLKALAVSSATPSPLAPDVPTLAKALNQPELDASFRLVLQTPSGTPPAVVAEIERAAMEIMKDPQVRARLQQSDVVAQGSSASEAQKVMKAEMARWAPVVNRLGLKSD